MLQLCQQLPNLIAKAQLQDIDNEYRYIKNMDFTKIFDSVPNVEIFWKTILKTKRGDDSVAFPLLCSFVPPLLSLPNS